MATATVNTASLVAQGLRKRFGSIAAVKEMSFTVSPGEVVGLLGPNGAGKTTVLRMLAGILTPDEGVVQVTGIDMTTDPLGAKRHVGFLSGDTQLYRKLSPRELLRFFAGLYEMPPPGVEARIQQLVTQLDMSSFADRPCSTLSAGQKQRANIARAFLHQPPLLILDEPTNALDIVSGRFIVEAIRQQRAEGRAILFSTHIMSEAEYLCDRIVMIHEGHKVEEGRPEEIIARSGCATLTDAFLKAIGVTPEGGH